MSNEPPPTVALRSGPASTRSRIRRRIAVALVPVILLTLTAQVQQIPAAAAWAPPAGTDVKGVKVLPVTAVAKPEWTATSREVTEADLPAALPAASDQVVDLTGAADAAKAATADRRIRAGSLPIYLNVLPAAAGLQARAAGAVPGKVRLSTLSQAAARSRGVTGLVMQLSRADGVADKGQVGLTVDYRRFASAFGGDWASRLRLVDLATGREVPSASNAKAGTITATMALPATGATTQVALAAAPQGEDGDYTATSLSAASTWQVSKQTGSFGWSYPIKSPAGLNGPAPALALSYDSGAIDGLTAGTNTQGSWIGDGWDMWPGYIERKFRACVDDRDTDEKKNPNNADVQGGDLCWFDDNATLTASGSGGELVKVASSETDADGTQIVQYRGVNDGGSKIEYIKGGLANRDVDKAYWRVTMMDGTQYYYGRSQGKGGSTGGTATDSVWTVPVYSNHPGEPGYDASFAASRHDRAWRWNLDYVVDPLGNTLTYFYDPETGAYGREGDKTKRTTYDRGGTLLRVEYGSRDDDLATVRPAARVVFTSVDRCVGANCAGSTTAAKYPDTPWDQYCATAPCSSEQLAPTFWTQKRLSTITTQVYAGTGDDYTDADQYTLAHTYLMAGTNEGKPMWLKSVTHTGLVTSAGGGKVPDPAVVFDPTADYMPNRVVVAGDGHSSLFRNRIAAITTESGAQIGISYSKPGCTGSTLPTASANTKPCFPQYYGAAGQEPKINWFHKYRVTRVDVYDNTGGFEHQQSNYDYLDSPGWAYDDSELVVAKKRTWTRYRGYGKVAVRQGLESGVQSKTEYLYFRGLNGDKQPKDDKDIPPTGTVRSVAVTDSQGTAIADDPAFAGMVREETVYNGADWINGTLTTPEKDGPTATSGPLKAWRTHTATSRSRLKKSDGTTRWTKTITSVNADNLPQQVDDLNDESTSADDKCITTEYARNGTTWMLDRVKRVETLAVACTATPQRPADVLADVRTYYDDPNTYGATPTDGLAVRVAELDSWTGTTPTFVTTATSGYDKYGRALSQTDALKRTTGTAYTPAAGGPVTATKVTNPAGQAVTTTLNPALGVATDTEDANGAKTHMTYDGAGHLLQVWGPGRDRAKTATATFSYKLQKNAPSYVIGKSLVSYGDATYRTAISLYDGLLRLRETQKQTLKGGRAITETVYDSRGLVDWTSSPYYDMENTAPQTTLVSPNGRAEIPAITQTVYDGADRPTASILLGSGTEKWRATTLYAGEKTSVIPPIGGTGTTSIVDARGRQVELRQYKDRTKAGQEGAGLYDRQVFTYTKLDQTRTIVDNSAANTWSYEYDLRGRQTVAKDPDKGQTDSQYDIGGRLEWTKDAAGRQLTYEYEPDKLGRKRFVHRGAITGPTIAEWTYDSLKNGKGRPSKAIHYEYDTAGNALAYSTGPTEYTIDGQPVAVTTTIPASEGGLCAAGGTTPCSFTTGYKYTAAGDLAQTAFPAVAQLPKETTVVDFNSIGQQVGLFGSQIYAQNAVYNQLDQLIGQDIGEFGMECHEVSGQGI